MNIVEAGILKTIYTDNYINQRDLSLRTGHSLGSVNQALKYLSEEQYLTSDFKLTARGRKYISDHSPKRAVILAAGYGMRSVPINVETPKGLIEIHDEPLIERIIRQLHEIDVTEIYVVVGYMKEKYEYLIDEFNINLIVNMQYSTKNNLCSLNAASEHLDNAYIIPCDIWCRNNPFSSAELCTWYMVSDTLSDLSTIHIARNKALSVCSAGGNKMIGIAYISPDDAPTLKKNLNKLSQLSEYDNSFWEDAIFYNKDIQVAPNVISDNDVVEINTYEQLRDFDSSSSHLMGEAISIICSVLNTDASHIQNITSLKKGMTNRSFLFDCSGRKYIMRIPGEGTSQLISRRNEAAVYSAIKEYSLSDNVLYINPDNGYKLTEYIEDARVCNANDQTDLAASMKLLRKFHDLKLTVEHEFDIFGQLEYYESLWNGRPSAYRDYLLTKEHVLSLRSYIESADPAKCLTHMDPNPDNILFHKDKYGIESPILIDWEYAGMADPHIDIAMFAIYAYFDKEQIDNLISLYFSEGCSDKIRIKIYCYVAVCGLLWSNWCEYKESLGIEFGEYALKQYRYAKDFYKIVTEELRKAGETL